MLYVFGWCKCHVWYQKQANLPGTTGNRIDNLCVPLVVLFPISYRRIPMRPYGNLVELGYFIEITDYRSNFAKTILFENCSCFSKIPLSICVGSPRIFQCLISIPAGHWVRQIDGDLPRRFFWSTLISLVISKIGRSERSARALRDGADVVREAIGNQFCLWICDSFLISTCREDWDLGLCTTSGLAFGDLLRMGDFRKKTCLDAGKIGFRHCAALL